MVDYDYTRLESESMVRADDGLGAKRVIQIGNLITQPYNSISLTYNSGSNPTQVVYKQNGTAVATLSLTYVGDNITEVQRS